MDRETHKLRNCLAQINLEQTLYIVTEKTVKVKCRSVFHGPETENSSGGCFIVHTSKDLVLLIADIY